MRGEEVIILTSGSLHLITKDQAWRYRILPREKSGNTLVLYCSAASDTENLKGELEVMFGVEVMLEVLSEEMVNRLLTTYYLKDHTGTEQSLPEISSAGNFLSVLTSEAKNLKSSDIHIEAYENKWRVRIRIDGMMVERQIIKKEDYPALINKIKILANLDIAEKRLPQDGRMQFADHGHKFDIRVSVLPTLYGEKVVLRLLNNDATGIDLETLGFSVTDLQRYNAALKRPNGIILISGPTGSGKTTTLYATLKQLNEETRNILTIEDPIEYTLEGINQVQLKESIGFNFPAALKTFLRQDPDVIMVGEIRDTDTANMAIRTAMTGHLVLSTIHTNSAWGTVSRLLDMGIPAFLIANTLTATVAQRLVRLLCPVCKAGRAFDPSLLPGQFNPPQEVRTHYVKTGCSECHFTGYRGRKAIYEVIPIDQELSREIKEKNLYIQDILKRKEIRTLSDNAFELFYNGLTSIDEVYPLLLNE